MSVLLPVRNGAATLAECLASLAAQTRRDHEVVVIDDGSIDATAAILSRHAAGDSRLRVVTTAARGLVPALNHALALARAPVVARMDADDVSHPERLRLQVERLEADANVDVLGSHVELVGASGNAGMQAYVRWLNQLVTHEHIVRDLLVESPLAHPSVAMRTHALRQLGGYRDFDGPEDYDLWLRAWAAGLRFASLPEVLLRWRDGPARLTRADPRYAPERFRAVKIEALERGPLRRSPPVVIWGAGPIGKGWGRALCARGHALAAFVEVHPRRIGQRIQDVPVVGLEDAAREGALHLFAVGQPGARARLRSAAASIGLVEGRDSLAVA